MMDGLLVGAILSVSLAICVFFVKFWRTTRDVLFLAFAFVFAAEGVSRLVALFSVLPSEHVPISNLIRLTAYVVLIATIIWKNRKPAVP